MRRDAAELADLSRLLDHGLDLDFPDRANWIESLDASVDPLKPALRRMLLSESDVDSATLGGHVRVAVTDAASARAREETGEGACIGPFELIRELGRGGMGTVWLARRRDGLVKHGVAVKLPHTGFLYAHLADRMAQEREILGRLNHPGISRLIDAGITSTGQPWLALEYVEGAPLTQYCDERGLSLDARIRLFIQVLSAIQYAHGNLVIHRDLKPANILVTPNGSAVVLDFGIAKLLSEDLTQPTVFTHLGGRALTPDYASPEQISGNPLTTASDVYSLGVILYELLLGVRPYRLTRTSPAALEEAIESASVGRPSTCEVTESVALRRGRLSPKKLKSTFKGDLDTVLLTALKRSPSDRYSSVDTFMEDLNAVLRDEPIGARAESLWDAARRFVIRHQWAAASTAAVVCALAIGLSTTLWQARLALIEVTKQRASKDFVIGLFSAVAEDAEEDSSPSDGTARQMLAMGTRQLFTQYRADSAIRLDLLELVCALDTRLELFDDASKTCDEATFLAARLYGKQTTSYAEALEGKAEALIEKGDTAQSTDIANEVLEILGKPRRNNAEIYAKANLLLGNAINLSGANQGNRSRHYLEGALDVLQRFDVRGDTWVRANYYLARTWEADGNYRQAEVAYLSGLHESVTRYGETSYQTAFGDDNYGNLLRNINRFAEAEQYLTAAHDAYTALYGAAHPDVANVRSNLALLVAAEGRRAEAEGILRETIETVTASRGEDSVAAADLRFHLAQLEIDRGLPAQAVASYERILRSRSGRDPGNQTTLATVKIDEAEALLQLGSVSAAEFLLDSAAAHTSNTDTPSIREVRWLFRRGEARLSHGDAAGAHSNFDNALELSLGLGNTAEEFLPSTLLAYGQILPARDVAVRQLVRVNSAPIVERMRSTGALSVDALIQLHTGLARLEQAAGDLNSAQNDFRQALELRMRHDDLSSPWLAQLYAMIAECQLQSGDAQSAGVSLAQADAALGANPVSLPAFFNYLRSVHRALSATSERRSEHG